MKLSDEQIGAELRALREVPSEEFAAELDAWAAEGFPSLQQLEKPSRAPSQLSRARQSIARRPALAALAGAAAVVTVVGLSVAAYLEMNRTSRSGDALFSAPESRTDSAPQTAAPADIGAAVPLSKGAQDRVSSLPPVQPVPPGSRPRNDRPQIQELSASLGLSTDPDELQGAADGVVEVTNRYDGLVDSSDVRVGGRQSHAAFSLRIPAEHVRDALDDFSQLGRVTLRDEASTNVTGAYVDAGKAYHEARAKVDSLLAQLRSASSPAEAAAIRQQLVPARQQLTAAREALRGLKGRVAYAPVSVQIRSDGDGSWSIGDAADDAVGVLEAIAGAALIALAVLLPIAALFILGGLGARELSRRRREATLDRT
jgi:hypothetical protein